MEVILVFIENASSGGDWGTIEPNSSRQLGDTTLLLLYYIIDRSERVGRLHKENVEVA
jgi:hypothetical protein